MKRGITVLFIGPLLTLLLAVGGCVSGGKNDGLVVIRGTTMGTIYNVKIVDRNNSGREIVPLELRADIEDILLTVNRQMSTYQKDSEISRFNRFQGCEWFPVSFDTAWVIKEAIGISQKSEGAFDITVGPLVNLWGFGTITVDGIPDEDEIKKSLKIIGYKNISVRLSPPSVRKKVNEICLDLSAIAKGYGVDKIAEFLNARKISSYLIEIGGEVRTRGKNHQNQWWRVGIATPTEKFGIQQVIQLRNQAMATSGDYRNYFEQNGIRYSHTINPITGRPVTHNLASVTVIWDSCMVADAMATAFNALGPRRGYDLAVVENLAAFFIIKEKKGFIEKATPLFEELLNRKSL